jgi:hypothetical protein
VDKTRARMSKLSNKRLIFGNTKDEWSKPPSYIGGGIGMQICKLKKTENFVENENENEKKFKNENEKIKYFEFIYSIEFNNLHEKYKRIADSGDINNMAIFLSQNPYHPEGFLQLVCLYIYVYICIFSFVCIYIYRYIYKIMYV